MPNASFTFYGVVADAYLDDNLDPTAFGLTAGAKVLGSLSLSGAAQTAYAAAINAQGKGQVTFDAANGMTLSFPQGLVRTWTAADVVPQGFDNVQIVSDSNTLPLTELDMNLYPLNAADGPNLSFNQFNVGAAHFTDDDDMQAFVYGVWIPSAVTPNLYYGGTGADNLKAKGDLALAWGGLGADKISKSGDGALYAWAGQGNDTVTGEDGDDHLFGDYGADELKGEDGDDKLFGGEGLDKIQGGDGDDLIDGGTGDDVLKGGEGDDVIYGATGADDIRGEDGDDTLYAGQQGPGETGYSRVQGGDGDDLLIAYTTGILKGGSGHDTFLIGDGESKGGVAHVVIEDFVKSSDKIHISIPGFDDFADLMSVARQDGKDVVFDLYPSVWEDPLVLIGVKLSSLKAGDFIFDAPDV